MLNKSWLVIFLSTLLFGLIFTVGCVTDDGEISLEDEGFAPSKLKSFVNDRLRIDRSNKIIKTDSATSCSSPNAVVIRQQDIDRTLITRSAYVINSPGYYCLGEDIKLFTTSNPYLQWRFNNTIFSGFAPWYGPWLININSSKVTFDLNNHAIVDNGQHQNRPNSLEVFRIQSVGNVKLNDITIKNGRLVLVEKGILVLGHINSTLPFVKNIKIQNIDFQDVFEPITAGFVQGLTITDNNFKHHSESKFQVGDDLYIRNNLFEDRDGVSDGVSVSYFRNVELRNNTFYGSSPNGNNAAFKGDPNSDVRFDNNTVSSYPWAISVPTLTSLHLPLNLNPGTWPHPFSPQFRTSLSYRDNKFCNVGSQTNVNNPNALVVAGPNNLVLANNC